MPETIFYAWQSDSPNSTNRGFIEKALDDALKRINRSLQIEEPVRLDKDTKGESGMVSVSDTIFNKIDAALAVVADVTVVGRIAQQLPHGKTKRPPAKRTPNPNVMIELGYAAKSLGWDRVIPVMDITGKASPDDLPFDLRHRRWPITYRFDDGRQKADVRAQLSGDLERELRNLLPKVSSSFGVREENAIVVRDAFHDRVRSRGFAGIDASEGAMVITVIPRGSNQRLLVLKDIDRSLLHRFEAISGGLVSRPGGDFHRNYYIESDNKTVSRATEIDERGVIRAVATNLYMPHLAPSGLPLFPSGDLEYAPVASLCEYVAGLRALEIHGPIWIDLSLLNLKRSMMSLRTGEYHPGHAFEGGDIVRSLTLCDPEGDPRGIPQAIATALRDVYDYAWRAFGFHKSPNFDAAGTWKPPSGRAI